MLHAETLSKANQLIVRDSPRDVGTGMSMSLASDAGPITSEHPVMNRRLRCQLA